MTGQWVADLLFYWHIVLVSVALLLL